MCRLTDDINSCFCSPILFTLRFSLCNRSFEKLKHVLTVSSQSKSVSTAALITFVIDIDTDILTFSSLSLTL